MILSQFSAVEPKSASKSIVIPLVLNGVDEMFGVMSMYGPTFGFPPLNCRAPWAAFSVADCPLLPVTSVPSRVPVGDRSLMAVPTLAS